MITLVYMCRAASTSSVVAKNDVVQREEKERDREREKDYV
jgi:hypothetical protein